MENYVVSNLDFPHPWADSQHNAAAFMAEEMGKILVLAFAPGDLPDLSAADTRRPYFNEYLADIGLPHLNRFHGEGGIQFPKYRGLCSHTKSLMSTKGN
jgi:hypothetical protein